MDIWLVIIVGVAVVLFLAARKPAQSPLMRSSMDMSDADPLPPPQTEDERLAGEAAAVREKWEAAQDTVDAQHRQDLDPMLEKLGKARELIKKSGVGEAACYILR